MFSSNSSQVSAANYIEDVFSTYLYTGNSSNRSITNNIDLSTKGGLVWIKNRNDNVAAPDHILFDTARGVTKKLSTNIVSGDSTMTNGVTAFLTNGFSLGTDGSVNNTSSYTYASWSFCKQSKFFDIVAYTGNGVAGRSIAHNLGSVPGCMIVKQLSGTQSWTIYHRSIGNTQWLQFDTSAAQTATTIWNNTTPTSTNFTVGSGNPVNANGETYIAYLFAHDAGGFGAAGTDNVISCGSYTGNGSSGGPIVTLGYEPQWLLIKRTDTAASWYVIDNMRNFTFKNLNAILSPDLNIAESSGIYVSPSATGFQLNTTSPAFNASGGTYIYVAIRRGPMRTPSLGTTVYNTVAYAGGTNNRLLNYGIPIDFWIDGDRNGTALAGYEWPAFTRILSNANASNTTSTAAWSGGWGNSYLRFDNNSGIYLGASTAYLNASANNYAGWGFSRAPGFFDVVAYTGTGVDPTSINHNLGVVPELIIIKSLSAASVQGWWVFAPSISGMGFNLLLNSSAAQSSTGWSSAYLPTSSVFKVTNYADVNGSGVTYAAYLFATIEGVSKVGSYTGTGALQTINCGFSSGARFVLIKRINVAGNWFVYDSARGITSGNDPYMLWNTTATEVTGTNYVDTDSTGFNVTAAASTTVNVNGGTYIYLAIA
jgi:hypothetical protein